MTSKDVSKNKAQYIYEGDNGWIVKLPKSDSSETINAFVKFNGDKETSKKRAEEVRGELCLNEFGVPFEELLKLFGGKRIKNKHKGAIDTGWPGVNFYIEASGYIAYRATWMGLKKKDGKLVPHQHKKLFTIDPELPDPFDIPFISAAHFADLKRGIEPSTIQTYLDARLPIDYKSKLEELRKAKEIREMKKASAK